jgi:hypothetical protein
MVSTNATPAIKVSAELREPHPFVLEAKKDLEKQKPDRDGFLHPTIASHLDIEVSPSTLDRALRIMDAILKAAEGRGFKVVRSRDRALGAELEVQGDRFTLSIRERRLQSRHVPTPDERWGPTFDQHPSGELRLGVRHKWGWRTKLVDRRRKPLEQVLDRFIPELIEGAQWVERVRENERQSGVRAAEDAERCSEEESRIKDLNQQVSNWHQSRRIREYLAAVREAGIRKWGTIEPGGPVDRWLSWADRYADDLDPLKEPSASES